jgi:hypothetical protein
MRRRRGRKRPPKSERDDSSRDAFFEEKVSRRTAKLTPVEKRKLDAAPYLTVCSCAKNESPSSEFESRTLAFHEKRGAAVSLRSLERVDRHRWAGTRFYSVVAGGVGSLENPQKIHDFGFTRSQSAREPPSIATAAAPVRARPTRKELAFVDASSESCQAPRDRTPA